MSTPRRRPPAAPRSNRRPFQQVHDLLEAAFQFDPDFGVYLWLLAVTGCRRGEACALRWTDIHWHPAEIAISRSIAQVDQQRIEKDTKTHQAPRVAIDDATRELLREFHLRARERALSVGVALADDAFLFSEEPDGSAPWRPDVCTNWFGRLRAELGLDHVRLHDVRHFVAPALGDAGTNIATISARLGYRNKATTLNIYSHSFPAADAEAGALIGTILGAVPTGRGRSTSGSPS